DTLDLTSKSNLQAKPTDEQSEHEGGIYLRRNIIEVIDKACAVSMVNDVIK
ncbi:14681_t:CDS:2, partial [Racocetra persica]